MLSDSFLKGLLAAHYDTEGSIRDAWTAARLQRGLRGGCLLISAVDILLRGISRPSQQHYK